MSKNIISYNSMFDASDYEKMKLQEQYNKLYHRGRDINEKQIAKKEKERFYNLSLKDVLTNMVDRLVKIMNDLVNYINDDKDKTVNRLIDIFTYNDRLLYFGLFLIIMGMLLFFIGGTS